MAGTEEETGAHTDDTGKGGHDRGGSSGVTPMARSRCRQLQRNGLVPAFFGWAVDSRAAVQRGRLGRRSSEWILGLG